MTNYTAHPLHAAPCPPVGVVGGSASVGCSVGSGLMVPTNSTPQKATKNDDKRSAANKANAKKSTGAVTPEGKAVSSQNAIRHGLLSGKAVLPNEDRSEYQQMLEGLLDSLEPVGLIEELLVERVAVAFWKQRRLLGAEAAAIQVSQSVNAYGFQTEVRQTAGLGFGDGDYLDQLSADEQETLEYNTALQAELDTIDYTLSVRQLRDHLTASCPLIMEVIEDDDDWDLDGLDDPKLWKVIGEIRAWVVETLKKLHTKQAAISTVLAVKAARSAPITNELLHRYQVAVDGELYRALAALRQQQEHRLKRLDTVVI